MKKIILGFLIIIGTIGSSAYAANEVEVQGFKDITETTGTVRYKINISNVKSYAVVRAVSATPQLSKDECNVAFTGPQEAGKTYFRTFSNLSPGTNNYVRVCVVDTNDKFFVSSGNEFFTTTPKPDGEVTLPIPDGEVTQPTSGSSIKLNNPLGANGIDNIPDLVKAILEIALKIGVPLIALAIIYAGFKFIAAQGNSEKLSEAKQTMIYVIVGAAILLAAYAIATAIVNTVGSVTG